MFILAAAEWRPVAGRPGHRPDQRERGPDRPRLGPHGRQNTLVKLSDIVEIAELDALEEFFPFSP